MNKILIFALAIQLFCCKTSYSIVNLKEEHCDDYRYGMIECKRLLSETDKKSLESKGLFVQDFLFDNVYQGTWYKNWDKMKLNSTPVKNLKAYSPEEKLSEGIKLADLENNTKPCNLLIQSIIPLQVSELNKYGKLINQNGLLYRLESQLMNVEPIVRNPCVKHISIMKMVDIPDLKN